MILTFLFMFLFFVFGYIFTSAPNKYLLVKLFHLIAGSAIMWGLFYGFTWVSFHISQAFNEQYHDFEDYFNNHIDPTVHMYLLIIGQFILIGSAFFSWTPYEENKTQSKPENTYKAYKDDDLW
jgi:hypothetical protein